MAPKNNGVAHQTYKWPPKTIAASLETAKCTDSELVSAARMYSHRTNNSQITTLKQMQAMWQLLEDGVVLPRRRYLRR
jgi:hypothetical protein